MVTIGEQPKVSSAGLRGLSHAEVAERRAADAVNTIQRRSTRSYARIVGQNLFTFLNLLIFAVSGVLAALGLFLDAVFAGMLGVVNASVAIVQEMRAKRALDRIAVLTRPQATVIRDSQEVTVEVAEIVRDDLLVVRPGDQVVVDGPVISAVSLSVDESLLTGESELVAKAAGDTLYSGSFCMTGSGVYRAERIGSQSTAEQITSEARHFRNVKTPLQREIIWLMRGLLVVILLLTLQVLGTFDRLYQDVTPDSSMTKDAARATAALIGLVPQGLVLMISITYAVAVIRLARRGILAHRMNAVESLSHVDVLCLDKTGTITTNQLQLHAFRPVGADGAEFQRTLADFVASGRSGNRTSAAIARACAGQSRPVREEVPFSSLRKWSGLIFENLHRGAYVLGAPEVLRPAIDGEAQLDDGLVEDWTAQGLRVLLFARSTTAGSFGDPACPCLPEDLVPLGFVVLSDELRADARETIRRFAEAGIALKVISGDHPNTVTALARQAGIEIRDGRDVVTGRDLEGLNREGIERVADRATIFARITPSQKQELVEALKRGGRYVAMVGDGVNDVPALKHAHVAVSMRSGSDVARSASDIVLLEDAFTVLPATFQEGQRIRNGLTTTMELFLTRIIYTTLIVFVTALAGEAFPVALRHGALVSMLAVGLPAFALTFWAQPGKVARRALPGVFDVALPAGVTIAAAALIVYEGFLKVTDDVALAQAALTVVTMLCGLTLIPFLRPPTPAWVGAARLSGDWRPALLAVLMLSAFTAVLLLPPLQIFWEMEPLPLWAYPVIAGCVPLWAFTVRLIWRRRVVARLRHRLASAFRGVAPRLRAGRPWGAGAP